jgi:L-aspartate oxidase
MFEVFDQRRYLIPFRSLLLPQIFTDTLVIGSGVAGMRAAIEAAPAGDVILLAKGEVELSNTAWAQGGIAAAIGDDDSVESHVQDTLEAGAGLCDEPAVRATVEDAGRAIEELIAWGMRFDREPRSGAISLGREGGHRRRRIIHADGDASGRELARCLVEKVARHRSIRVFENCFALDLLTTGGANDRGESRVLGVICHHPRYGLQIIWAKATILATGGAGRVYRETTNPRLATGDGLAMAWRAGALAGDVEFMQFHPTALYVAGANRILITEAVRGEGAHLIDRDGRRFMRDHHEMAELAPRDVVSRAIIAQLGRTGGSCVYLDVRHLDQARFAERFPALMSALRAFDLDPAEDPIPVCPCAHYTIGGVWTDLDGRTSLPGLYACGEAACHGLHGANRLASNSLLEGLVFGRRAALAAREMAGARTGPVQIISDIPLSEHGEIDLVDVESSLRSAMWRNVGIERSGGKLDDALDMLHFWGRYTLDKIFDDPSGWETQNLLTVAALMTRAARWRTETRGVHLRLDYPRADDSLRAHATWSAGREQPALRPVIDHAEARS